MVCGLRKCTVFMCVAQHKTIIEIIGHRMAHRTHRPKKPIQNQIEFSAWWICPLCKAFFRLCRNFLSYTVDSCSIFPVRYGNFFSLQPLCTKPGLKLFVVCSVRFRHCVCNKDILILHTRFFLLHFGLLLTFFLLFALHFVVVSWMWRSGGSKEWNKCLLRSFNTKWNGWNSKFWANVENGHATSK